MTAYLFKNTKHFKFEEAIRRALLGYQQMAGPKGDRPEVVQVNPADLPTVEGLVVQVSRDVKPGHFRIVDGEEGDGE